MVSHKLLIRKPLDCKVRVEGCSCYLITFIVNYSALHGAELCHQKYLSVTLGAVHTQTN